MYSFHKNVQIILSLMKQYGIRNIVASAGTRNISLVFSALQDDYFKLYSVVDERSAGFFALGLIQSTQEPAAIVCTSGTASCNYLSAVTEAHYQHLPLVVLTSDRHHYKLNQQEDQCIPQQNLYTDMVRKMVDLPIVRDEMDEWYCGRIVNEALLELDHREKGPVHINFQVDPVYPAKGGDFRLDQPTLPQVKKIDRVMADDDDAKWQGLAEELKGKKVLLLYGQNLPTTKEEIEAVESFCERYNVVVVNEHISNRKTRYSIKSSVVLNMLSWTEMLPDIVITMGGHRMADPKGALKSHHEGFRHWHVSRAGEVSDPFMSQTKIVECRQEYFFRRMASMREPVENTYFKQWTKMEEAKYKRGALSSDFEYSGPYAVKRLLEAVNPGSFLHISNSNSIRLATYFDIPEGVDVYCNRGTCGIDGSMSTYVAQSFISEKQSYMVIGDLSFFYDMNALWNHYINPRTRIMLINNSGGAILNFGAYKTVNVEGSLVNTAAAHHTSAQGWVESRGFKYLSAHNEEEFEKAVKEFTREKSDAPMLLEVFTDMDKDIEQRDRIVSVCLTAQGQMAKGLKDKLPLPVRDALRRALGKR